MTHASESLTIRALRPMPPSKRLFDLSFTIIGLAVLWPLIAIVALLIVLTDGFPVFYRQERVGRNGTAFRIWKFRTMVRDADKRGLPLTGIADPRVTKVGRWLRLLKLDELPQLFNVLAGDMSLVGPRPEVRRYVDQYTPAQRRVLELVPGITDYATLTHWDERVFVGVKAGDVERVYIEQVLPDKLRKSIEYAEQATVWTDLTVLVKTVTQLAAK